jgi:aspartate racemase
MGDRIIGIIGGMGPQATADLFSEIIHLTPVRMDQDHIRVLIYSNSKIPDRTSAILGKGKDPLPAMVETARTLERAGAGILAIPCNAAHHFLPRLQARIRTPILNMIRETCAQVCLRFPDIKSVGLLAATGTVRSRVYHEEFARAGLEVLAPEGRDQDRVHGAIWQVKAGRLQKRAQRTFELMGAKLTRRGAGMVILGCTEIPLAFAPGDVGYHTINSTRVLAQAAVDWALARRK